MSGTKIVVIQRKKMITAGIFALLGIILLVILLVLFWPGKNSQSLSMENSTEKIYQAGIYTEEIKLGDASVNLQVSLDENQVKSVELINLEESVETMYPLMKPTVEKISEQLVAGKDMDEIVLSEDAQYTEKMLLEKISDMLEEHKK